MITACWHPESRMRQSLWGPVLLALLLQGGLLLQAALRWGGDFSYPVLAAETRRDHPAFAELTHFDPGPGYDGQFYFILAHDPWRLPTDGLDHPVRHLRPGYPVVVWLFSAGGQRAWLPFAMLGVNFTCLIALTAFAAAWARRHQQSPWWGIWLPFATTALAPTLRNLTDPLSLVALVGLLWAWERRNWQGLFLAGFVALFTREQNLPILGMVTVAAAIRRDIRSLAAMLLVGLLWMGWLFTLKQAYGQWPFLPSGGNLAAPGVGFQTWWDTPTAHRKAAWFRVLYLLFLASQVLLWGMLLARWAREEWRTRFTELGLGIGGLIVVLLVFAGPSLWNDWWSYTRNFAPLPLAVWWGCARVGWRTGLGIAAGSAPLAYATLTVF